jgi:hypothetical protein
MHIRLWVHLYRGDVQNYVCKVHNVVTTGLRIIGFALKRVDILTPEHYAERYHFTAHMWGQISVKYGDSPCVHHHTPVRKRKRNKREYSGSRR